MSKGLRVIGKLLLGLLVLVTAPVWVVLLTVWLLGDAIWMDFINE